MFPAGNLCGAWNHPTAIEYSVCHSGWHSGWRRRVEAHQLWPRWFFLFVIFGDMSVTGFSRFVKVAIIRVVMVMIIIMIMIVMVTVISITIGVVVNAEGTSSFSAAYDFSLVVTLFRLSVVSARHLCGYR